MLTDAAEQEQQREQDLQQDKDKEKDRGEQESKRKCKRKEADGLTGIQTKLDFDRHIATWNI